VRAADRERPASAIAPAAPILEAEQPEPIASAARISRAVVREIEMPLEAAPGDLTDRAHAATAIVVSPAWDLGVEVSIGVEVSAAVEASVVVAEASEEAVEAGEVAAAAGRRPSDPCQSIPGAPI
jgi:hypothetical protein